MLCDQTIKLLFWLFGFPGIVICEESRGTLTVYSRKRVHFLAAILGSILIVPRAFAGELGALCSAAKNFVSAAKTQEGILITYPTASEFAASTIAYAAAKERYFSEFRAEMPILIAIDLKQRPETGEIEEFRSALAVAVLSLTSAVECWFARTPAQEALDVPRLASQEREPPN